MVVVVVVVVEQMDDESAMVRQGMVPRIGLQPWEW